MCVAAVIYNLWLQLCEEDARSVKMICLYLLINIFVAECMTLGLVMLSFMKSVVHKQGKKLEKCEEELEVNIQKLRNRKISLAWYPWRHNALICWRNAYNTKSRTRLEKGDIRAKLCYTTKRKTRSLLTEVDSGTQKKLMQARIKLGWAIYSIDDYTEDKRCFRCSRYNHNFQECKREETCPLCTGSHKLKECTATKSEHKCINCLICNKHHQTNQTDTVHSSLDKNSPSLLVVLEKYKQNTDY
jgi:hypothetical protein